MPLSPDTKREVARKILHMSMGLFALCLRWLTPWQAALCALAALLHNLYIFPHYGMKKLERPEEKARGYSGMVGYPAVVLVLILLTWAWVPLDGYLNGFIIAMGWNPLVRESMALASVAWAFLAFGDAFGALCGIFLRGPRLPWNPKKTWSGLFGFVIIGSITAAGVGRFLGPSAIISSGPQDMVVLNGVEPWSYWEVIVLAGIVAAIVESLPDQLDDNLSVPLAAWAVMALSLVRIPWWAEIVGANVLYPWTIGQFLGLLLLNATLAGIAHWRGWVDRWGFLLGFLFGAVVAFGFGVPGYCILLLFYLVANGSTYFGKKTKERRGIAEAHGGQRRTGSVFSKGFMPAVFSLLSFPAFVASLATYAADTAASEFGKTAHGRTLSLRTWKVVPAGSVGAISLRGTAAGLTVLALFGVGTWCWSWFSPLFPFLPGASEFPFLGFGVATVFCFFFESWFNEWNYGKKFFSKEVIHVCLGGLSGMLVYFPEVARSVFCVMKAQLP